MIQRSTFVPQFDIAVDSLTAREHLFFMCELRMDRRVSRFQKNDRINDTLWKLGLMKVADCRISTLSGGERKTLNLATEVTVILNRSSTYKLLKLFTAANRSTNNIL